MVPRGSCDPGYSSDVLQPTSVAAGEHMRACTNLNMNIFSRIAHSAVYTLYALGILVYCDPKATSTEKNEPAEQKYVQNAHRCVAEYNTHPAFDAAVGLVDITPALYCSLL